MGYRRMVVGDLIPQVQRDLSNKCIELAKRKLEAKLQEVTLARNILERLEREFDELASTPVDEFVGEVL